MPGYWKNDPIETFRRQVWINPFWEDDVYQVVECMGADRVIFGSDWPHIEALPEPLDYIRELKDFDAADRRKILHDNVTELIALRPSLRDRAHRPSPKVWRGRSHAGAPRRLA